MERERWRCRREMRHTCEGEGVKEAHMGKKDR
jgi:hypothetical protein